MATVQIWVPIDELSRREREVLRLVAMGHTNAEIAAKLFLSRRTIETHRSHIQVKLQLRNRADLVAYALAWGLLDDDRPSYCPQCGREMSDAR